jgi:hypothetical protein
MSSSLINDSLIVERTKNPLTDSQVSVKVKKKQEIVRGEETTARDEDKPVF